MLQSADFQPPAAPSAPTTPHIVLRALCMAGERVEVGAEVQLTAQQSTELVAAGRVARVPLDASGPAGKPPPKAAHPRRA